MLKNPNLNMKTIKSAENLAEKTKLIVQKKISVNDISPTLNPSFTNKSGINLSNFNTDPSIMEDIVFLKNELQTPLRKETNYSLNLNPNSAKAIAYNASLGKIQDGMAVLLGDDMNLIEFPLELLPHGSKKGNIFKISIERNLNEEELRKDSILNIQKEILENNNFFKNF